MQLFVGTSGFSYPAWRGSFYPRNQKPEGMLAFYATRFSAVEINASAYRAPTEATLRGWAAQVPDGFRFTLKAPKPLLAPSGLERATPKLAAFTEVVRALGAKLGPLILKLPEGFPKDLKRLRAFLALLPADLRVALEFRDPSWFGDDTAEVLRDRGAALCWEEADELASPCVSTAGFGYARLRRLDYGDSDLAAWVKRLRAQPWSELYVFFKHEDEARGPVFAERFRTLWAEG